MDLQSQDLIAMNRMDSQAVYEASPAHSKRPCLPSRLAGRRGPKPSANLAIRRAGIPSPNMSPMRFMRSFIRWSICLCVAPHLVVMLSSIGFGKISLRRCTQSGVANPLWMWFLQGSAS